MNIKIKIFFNQDHLFLITVKVGLWAPIITVLFNLRPILSFFLPKVTSLFKLNYYYFIMMVDYGLFTKVLSWFNLLISQYLWFDDLFVSF